MRGGYATVWLQSSIFSQEHPFFFLRDELLSGMTKLDEQLDTYLASMKQLKSLDLSTDELKDQQETLQAAISNTQHPLHTVQAK